MTNTEMDLRAAFRGLREQPDQPVPPVEEVKPVLNRGVRAAAPVRTQPRPNRYGGKCVRCSVYVQAEEGTLSRGESGWEVAHTECPAVQETLPVAETVRPQAPSTSTVPSGSYALDRDGEVKFYSVDNPERGKWAGYTFVSVQASDEFYPVKGAARAEVLKLIAADPEAASVLYGRSIGKCGRCGRTLTDSSSISAGIGPICAQRSW